MMWVTLSLSNPLFDPCAQEVHQKLCLGIASVRRVTVALSEKELMGELVPRP